jgi:hypothetical protein
MVKPDWAGVFPALCTVTDAKGDLDGLIPHFFIFLSTSSGMRMKHAW